jgi:peptide/nickel transport system substrate-binding protein
MRHLSRMALAAFLAGVVNCGAAYARSQVTIGVTETISSYNPYADSVGLAYGIWCEVLGCLGIWDYDRREYVGRLAESWEVDKSDPNIWTFHLKHGVKRQNDGKEFTSADVVHSFERINSDPQSMQKANVTPVKEMIAVDPYTVKVVTKQPTASLLEFLFDRFIITSKDLYEKYGASGSDRKYLWGWGPYKLKEIEIGQRIVLEKDPTNPAARANNPDTLIFTIMREPEQRVTALLNHEIQIAQFIPPQLASRVSEAKDARLVHAGSTELMFLAMSPKFKPWNNVKLRQAVCYAIDRDAIIKNVLDGKADRLDGPIGPAQYGYDPTYAKKDLFIPYDPAKAKELVKESGYGGEPVDLDTPVGRYIDDKEVTQAMISMLNAVGIKARLRTPEWSTLWADVQKGKVPFYYMGRGTVVDPSVALQQYFETGGSPRIGISDPEIDKALETERVTFDPSARRKALNIAFKKIEDAAPACFLWTHQMLYGISNNVEYKPNAGGRIFGTEIFVKQ